MAGLSLTTFKLPGDPLLPEDAVRKDYADRVGTPKFPHAVARDAFFAPPGGTGPGTTVLEEGQVVYLSDSKTLQKCNNPYVPVWVVVGGDGGGGGPVGGLTKFMARIGDGASTAITVVHGLNTRDIVASVYDASTYVQVACEVVAKTITTAEFRFTTPPLLDAIRIVIVG